MGLKEEMDMKILSTPRMERCIGCHSCSLACARLEHKVFARSGIPVTRVVAGGSVQVSMELASEK